MVFICYFLINKLNTTVAQLRNIRAVMYRWYDLINLDHDICPENYRG